jgi:hypothetical protein
MKPFILAGIALIYMAACNNTRTTTMDTADSTNAQNKNQAHLHNGWQSLITGNTLDGWHNYGQDSVGAAWSVTDGVLKLDASKKDGWQIKQGGDIVTDDEYENFHLKLQWKIDTGGNSGIMFYVHEDTTKYQHPWNTGPEMQVLDNARHADAKINKHRAGDLYDLISASPETVKSAGEWNDVEIIADKGNLRFMLNGTQVVQTTMWDDAWKNMIANSKFKQYPGFGTFKKGKIALQDHGDNVWYRNVMIRKL